jgi:hypothetical protein|eukprot:COSAG01_NODE_4287_length_5173_cov_12.473000_6_plen_227_part_00
MEAERIERERRHREVSRFPGRCRSAAVWRAACVRAPHSHGASIGRARRSWRPRRRVHGQRRIGRPRRRRRRHRHTATKRAKKSETARNRCGRCLRGWLAGWLRRPTPSTLLRGWVWRGHGIWNLWKRGGISVSPLSMRVIRSSSPAFVADHCLACAACVLWIRWIHHRWGAQLCWCCWERGWSRGCWSQWTGCMPWPPPAPAACAAKAFPGVCWRCALHPFAGGRG